MRSTTLRELSTLLALLPAVAAGGTAKADAIEDFYRGRNLSVLVGVSGGGEYDFQMRLIARHIGRHLPGKPNTVPQNMVGATGLVMANYLYTVAAKDGATIGLIQNGLPTYQTIGMPNAQFDITKLNWIGSIAPTVETMAVWKGTKAQSIEEARKTEVVAGAVGRDGITYTFPLMLNQLAGTKFKIVPGYTGSNELNAALEKGEVEARNNAWSSWKTSKPHWLADKSIAILVYAGPQPPDLPGVPSVEDFATSEADRKVMELVIAGTRFGHPFATSPGVPAERVQALRDAFAAVLKDPDFLKEAAAAKLEVLPVSGLELQQLAETLLATPAELKVRAKQLYD